MTPMTITFLEDGHAASPAGWGAATAACGIKYKGRDDLALLVSAQPCSAAAIFTTNKVKAAPLRYDMALMGRSASCLRAVVINAVAPTPAPAREATRPPRPWPGPPSTPSDLPADSVLVMSTGVDRRALPMDKILAAIAAAAAQLAPDGGHAAARAIMTTDTRPKRCAVRVELPAGRTSPSAAWPRAPA